VRVVAVALAVAVVSLGGCDSADSRTTARVSRIDGSRACLVPEDSAQEDLEGCFPFNRADARKLKRGACVDLRVPSQLEEDRRDEPLYSVKVLDRRCKR
jgi:hypothetical protein